MAQDAPVGPIARDRHEHDDDGVAYVSHSTFFACLLDERSVVPVGLPGEVLTGAGWWLPSARSSVPLRNRRIPELAALAVDAVRP